MQEKPEFNKTQIENDENSLAGREFRLHINLSRKVVYKSGYCNDAAGDEGLVGPGGEVPGHAC